MHLARFQARLRKAARHRNDPYIDVGLTVEVPARLIRRHTVVPGDYYPTKSPGAIIPGDGDVDAWVLAEMAYYVDLCEALEGRRDWETTEIYTELVGEAMREGRPWRRDECLAEARERVRGYELIYQSMRLHGFLTQKELAAARPGGYKPLQFDEVSVGVARDGEIQVCQGGHRFAIAKAVGIEVLAV